MEALQTTFSETYAFRIKRDRATVTVTGEVWYNDGKPHRIASAAVIDCDPKTGLVTGQPFLTDPTRKQTAAPLQQGVIAEQHRSHSRADRFSCHCASGKN